MPARPSRFVPPLLAVPLAAPALPATPPGLTRAKTGLSGRRARPVTTVPPTGRPMR
jgi:hypothetical protein